MGKLGDQLRREQEQEANVEADRITNDPGWRRNHLDEEGVKIKRQRASQQTDALRQKLQKFPAIDKDEDVYTLFKNYPEVSTHTAWGVVRAVRASRRPADTSGTEVESSPTEGFLPPHRY